MTKARRATGLRGQVNVLVTSNRVMRDLNRRFRHKDKPTDVLSFPSSPTLPSGTVWHPRPPDSSLAGEIAISGQIAAENGRKLGHGTSIELKVLVLHGVLHLAGYDHESDDGKMARKEHKLRRELGLPDALIERAALRSRSLDSAYAKSASAPLGMTNSNSRRRGPVRSKR